MNNIRLTNCLDLGKHMSSLARKKLIAFYTILVTGYTDADCNPSCSAVGSETEPLCNTTTQKCLHGCIEGFAGEKCQFMCSSNCSDCTVNE